jgi:hypothetical protein
VVFFVVLGAGWGGCTVSLVAEDQVDGFIRKIKEEYPPYKGLDEVKLNEAIFATRPGRGACGECFDQVGSLIHRWWCGDNGMNERPTELN